MRKPLIAAVVGVLALALAGIAVATEQFTQTYKLTYTSQTVKASTGIKLALTTTDPGAPNQTPSAAKKVVMDFHPGTVFDTEVPTRCNKTDQQVQDSAGAACPSKSKVGTGSDGSCKRGDHRIASPGYVIDFSCDRRKVKGVGLPAEEGHAFLALGDQKRRKI